MKNFPITGQPKNRFNLLFLLLLQRQVLVYLVREGPTNGDTLACAPDQTLADDFVELLAINHGREEEAIPIRRLYLTDLGPVPKATSARSASTCCSG